MRTDQSDGEVMVNGFHNKRGIKRKATMELPVSDAILKIANDLALELNSVDGNDPIFRCGKACINLLRSRPEVVLDLARQKLHAWPYKEIPLCWRRMFEEASLWSAFRKLGDEAERVPDGQLIETDESNQQRLTEMVKILDTAIQMTGSPGRGGIFEKIFKKLEPLVSDEVPPQLPTCFSTTPPLRQSIAHPMPRRSAPPSFTDFQTHLDDNNTPMIIKGAVEDWPALDKWTYPAYWLQRTLGGRRLVPVEIGSQYTDSTWSQRILPFKDFLSSYLLDEANKVGYLAQYDLFAQIPALRDDVQVPDYCYCSPPRSQAAYPNGRFDEDDEDEIKDPLMNLWLGPAGTKTPLHTDPYSNILVQVMGYKYVRLYAPEESEKLYPMGVDENGVGMSNTASVDVALACSKDDSDLEKTQEQTAKYPLFGQAEFIEGIIGPEECLYIPQGWWHYVEGLTLGASVSFWWN